MNFYDAKFVKLALQKASESVAQGGFPAGAVVVKNGQVIGEGISIGNKINDPTSHGEMAAIRNACKNLQTSDLRDCVLYTSMQPCVMCLGASAWSVVSKIVYACSQHSVSADYYSGNYKISDINTTLAHPIELVHASDFQEQSLALVRAWEKDLSL